MISDTARGFPARRAMTRPQLGHLALQARREFCPQVGDAQAIDGLRLFETLHTHRLKHKGYRLPIISRVRPFPPPFEGLTLFSAHKEVFRVQISQRTYAGLEVGDPEARLTVSHEVGHLCCHSHELITLAVLPDMDRAMARATASHPFDSDVEWQADVFALRFMVPDAGLTTLLEASRLTVNDIKHQFGVPDAWAKFRLNEYWRERDVVPARDGDAT